MVFQPIPDTAVKLTNLKSGAIDVVDEIDIKDVEAVSKDSALKVYSVVGSRWPMLRLNTTMPPFDKLPLRQAVSHAINREALVKGAFFGNAQPAYGPISPIYKSVFDPNVAQYALTYDPARAKQKLAEGGKPDGFSFQLDTGGTPDRVRQAELLQNDLAAVGIRMEVRTMDSAAFTDRLRTVLALRPERLRVFTAFLFAAGVDFFFVDFLRAWAAAGFVAAFDAAFFAAFFAAFGFAAFGFAAFGFAAFGFGWRAGSSAGAGSVVPGSGMAGECCARSFFSTCTANSPP